MGAATNRENYRPAMPQDRRPSAPSPVKRLVTVASTIILLLVTIAFVLAWEASSRLLVTRGRVLEERHLRTLAAPGVSGLTIDRFAATATDGTTLAAYLIGPSPHPGTATKFRRLQDRMRESGRVPPPAPGAPPRGTIFMLHGRCAIKEDAFPVAERLCAAGFRCVAFDARSNGESTGRFATYGMLEAGDARAVLDAAIERFDLAPPYGIYGISRGGAEALQAAAQDDRFTAVVSVSTFANLGDLTREVARDRLGIAGSLLRPLVAQICRYRAGLDPDAISPVRAAAEISAPSMIVHGLADTYIRPRHGRQIFDALASPHKVWREVPGGAHYDVLASGGDALYLDIVGFLGQALPAAAPVD